MSRLSLLVLVAACATTPPPPEKKVEPPPPPVEEHDDLSQAWDRDTELAPSAPRPMASPAIDRTAGFKSASSAAHAAVKSKNVDEARAQVATAVKEAANLDGEARFQAHQLAFKVEQLGGDVEAQVTAADAWRLACGPEKVDACRTAALTALEGLAKAKGADKALVRRVHELQDAELCSSRAEKGGKPNPCEATTTSFGKREGDALFVQRVKYGQAMRETTDQQRVALLDRAETSCSEARCAALRRKILGKLISASKAKNDVDGTVKYALREVQAVASGNPADLKVWSRTPSLDSACVAYDAAHGAGSCRVLEKKTVGYWSFHDYSKDEGGQGLSGDQVKQVNDHFAPLLQECLSEQARRMKPPDAQRFEVQWVVLNDGHVGEAHMKQKDLDGTPIAKCLKAQFGGWRYPKYEGEFQNVEQAFTVTAVERRTR